MKTPILLWVSTLLLIISGFPNFTYAQGPCNNPVRPITGNGANGSAQQHPCAGDTTIIYQIANIYNSYEWTPPRAAAGDPEGAGWVILEGQGTSQIRVKVGKKSGTVVVKVQDGECGTKVATIPVKPGQNFEAFITGPDSVCVGEPQTYTATVNKGNGQANASGEFVYNWVVPADWQIISGQGTETLVVEAGLMDGEVTLYVTDNTEVSGNGNSGTGVGGYKAGFCGTASASLFVETNANCGPCPLPYVTLAAPDTICNLSDEPTTISVESFVEGTTYVFDVPEGFVVLDEGPGYVTVVAIFEEAQLGQPQTISVTATNSCGTDIAEATVIVADCGDGTPFPVTITSFDGVSRNGAVELTWSTASEINNDKFEVERSLDGKNFQKIGEVKGSGNSTVVKNYTYTDRFKTSGTVYYRLKQVDLDNAFEYSKVIAVNHSATGTGKMSIAPNPVTNGEFTVFFGQANKGAALIRLRDMTGRQMFSQEVGAGRSEANLNIGSLNLRAGIYLISVTANGQNTTHRIVIQ
ncbi:T9SS type A sorting domain-containing protein [Rufibacter radiotolerans]|uniref:T9SS type A sorting domain-containing protein n=1 Tax=Rufibacter radiotolerans TaxID=1379910 RepID=UPI0009E54FA6|nr:T9SS type A sorting domain-containing protein [Rufibacter radiotolerans]